MLSPHVLCALPCVQHGWCALIYAARYGYFEIVKALLAAGANIEIQTNKVIRGEGVCICAVKSLPWYVLW